MIELSTSFCKGRGNLEHNKRNLFYALSNVNMEKSSSNIALVDDDLHETYTRLFDSAVREHDEKETRKDRKINDYYEFQRKQKAKGNGAKKGQPKKLFTEFVIQFGSRKTVDLNEISDELLIQMYTEYFNSFRKRNPNLIVFGAYIHLDEKTPHLHLDIVPCSKTSRKMSLTNSFDNALQEQGYNVKKQKTGYRNWRNDEISAIENIYKNYEINRVVVGNINKHNSNSHLDLDQKYTTQVNNALIDQTKIVQETTEKFTPFKVKQKVGFAKSEEIEVVKKEVLDEVIKENILVSTQNNQLHNALADKDKRIQSLEKEDLHVENNKLKNTNESLNQQLSYLQSDNNTLKINLKEVKQDKKDLYRDRQILEDLVSKLCYAFKYYGLEKIDDLKKVKSLYGNSVFTDQDIENIKYVYNQKEMGD